MILAFSTCFSVPQLYHFETLRVETLAYGGRWCAIIQKVFWVVQDTLEGVSKKTIRSPRHLDYICHKCNGLQRLHLSIFRSYAFNSFHQSFIVTHFFGGTSLNKKNRGFPDMPTCFSPQWRSWRSGLRLRGGSGSKGWTSKSWRPWCDLDQEVMMLLAPPKINAFFAHFCHFFWWHSMTWCVILWCFMDYPYGLLMVQFWWRIAKRWRFFFKGGSIELLYELWRIPVSFS